MLIRAGTAQKQRKHNLNTHDYFDYNFNFNLLTYINKIQIQKKREQSHLHRLFFQIVYSVQLQHY